MKKSLFFILSFYFIHLAAFAQYTLEGQVRDAETQEALVGVSVWLDEEANGTTTNSNGQFSIQAQKPNSSLSFTFVGYDKETIAVNEGSEIRIALQPSTVALEQVVVSASRDAQKRTDAPLAIGKVSAQMLEETKPTMLDQVLNKVSGVYMVNLGNEQHSMSVRQPISTKSLFLYLEDGLPIRPTGVFNHNALIEMNMGALKTIEVIRGPSSSLYGSEAIGGAMNFITHRATAVPTAGLRVQGDNQGYRRSDFKASATVNNKLGVSLGGYYAQRREGYRDHSDFNKIALTATLDYTFSENTKLETTTTFIDYQTDMTGSLDSTSFYGQEYSSLHTFTERSVKAFRTQWKLSQRWSSGSNTDFRVFYRDNSIGQIPTYRISDDQSYSNPNGDPHLAHGEINDNSFQSLGGLVQHNQNLNWLEGIWRVGASIDYSPTSYYANYMRVDISDEGIYNNYTETDSVLAQYDVDVRNSAAYTQLEISPTQALRVVAALRYDHFRYDYNNYLPPTAYSGAPDAVNTFQAVSPKLGLTYDLQQNRGLYANYSIGFVPPQIGELYRGVKVPSLEPSTYYNYEIGGWFGFLNQKAILDISLYQMEGKNEIVSTQLDNGSYENRNAGRTLHQGIEYTFKAYPVQALEFRLSGSNALHKFLDYEEEGTDFSDNQMNGAPNLISNTEIIYRPEFLPGLRLSLEWQHVDEYYLDEANTEKYEGFDILNARAGYSFKGIEVWVNSLNLTDQLYATNASKSQWGKSYTPGAPRTFQFGIGYQFVKD